MLTISKAFRFIIKLKLYAGIATKIPQPVATNASEIDKAMAFMPPAEASSLAKVSSMLTTVPKSPIKGEVEATIASKVKPLVPFDSAKPI